MPVSINNTQVVFNDATVQTTAYVAAAAIIPSGSVTNFYQSAAPTGWTQVVTMNDYAMRIVSGTGGTTAGTTAFSTVFSNQTPSINVSGLSAGATTLSTAQMPSHNHTTANSVGCSGGCGYYGSRDNNPINNSGSTGGGGSHSHSISGSASSSAITLNVLYQNHILCSKN